MIKEEGDFTHFYDDPKNKTLVLYRIKDKTPRRAEVPYLTEFPFAVAQFKNELYFTGGGKSTESHDELFLKTAMRVKVDPKDMDTIPENLPEMTIARTKHSMVVVNSTSIYVVGGLNSNGIIASCEEYEISKSAWKKSASLNEQRMRVSLIAIDPKYIYAFGGERNKELNGSKMIESLDTSDKEAKLWTKVTLTLGTSDWPEIRLSGTFQVSSNDIMIFGGYVGKTEISTTFIFNIPEKVMKKSKDLAQKDVFLMTRPVVDGSDLIVLGKNDGHRYNLLDNKWSLLKKETLTPIAGFFVKADTI
jgi:hypothetical protein